MTASMDEERAGVSSSPATEHEEARDPACWAHRVCPECNRLNQADHPDACEACGVAFPAYWARGAGLRKCFRAANPAACLRETRLPSGHRARRSVSSSAPPRPWRPGNTVGWTGKCGDAAAALQAFRELLPDQVRVLGPDHPGVLAARSNIAAWTARSGGVAWNESEADPDGPERESKTSRS